LAVKAATRFPPGLLALGSLFLALTAMRPAMSYPSQASAPMMLDDSYKHLDIDKKFLTWLERDRVLEASQVVVEWLDKNPFADEDSQYAPVGNYMFSPADSGLIHDV
jgi:hypothetical protein